MDQGVEFSSRFDANTVEKDDDCEGQMDKGNPIKARKRSKEELDNARNGTFICSRCQRSFEYRGKKFKDKLWQYTSGRLLFCGTDCNLEYQREYWGRTRKPVTKKPRKVVEQRERQRIKKVSRADKLLQRLTENGFKCEYSGLPLTVSNMQLDHIIPVCDGGSSKLSNVAIVHKDINRMKGSMGIERFIELCKRVVAREQDVLAIHAAANDSEPRA